MSVFHRVSVLFKNVRHEIVQYGQLDVNLEFFFFFSQKYYHNVTKEILVGFVGYYKL